MLARLAAFVVWALVAATVVFWGLRMVVRPSSAPAYAVTVGDDTALRGDLGRLLGATPVAPSGAAPVAPAPELASRFKLLGVMAGRSGSGSGYALIAVDAKPARAYAVGAALDGDLVLQSVSLRSAAIGPAQGSAALTLEVPALPAPATGSLPAASDGLKFGAAAEPPAPMALPTGPAVPPPSGALPATPGAPASPPVPRTRAPGVTNR